MRFIGKAFVDMPNLVWYILLRLEVKTINSKERDSRDDN